MDNTGSRKTKVVRTVVRQECVCLLFLPPRSADPNKQVFTKLNPFL